MNERIKELAEQAGFDKHHIEYDTRIKQFDALIRADEREACAKLVEEVGRQTAEAIRQRGDSK